MHDAADVPLQRLYMVQAIDLFQAAYQPYVLDHLRAHFGERLNAHLRSLMKRNNAPIFVDFVDGQPQPDFLALIHLMTRDGGLHTDASNYTPVLFAPNGATQRDVRPALVPPFKELRLVRLRRNALNHQGHLSGEMIIDSIVRMMRMVALLPPPYYVQAQYLQLQLLCARAQSVEYAHQLAVVQMTQEQRVEAARKQEELARQHERFAQQDQQLLQIEHSITLHQQDTQRAQQHLATLQTQLDQLVHEQQLLVSGTAEAVVDGRRALEERIAQLQQQIAHLPTTKSPDTATLYTMDRLQRELAAQQQITADMRIELNRLHEQIDTLRSAPLATPTRRSWTWVGVLTSAFLIGWLWYSGWLMWGIMRIQPYIRQLLELVQ